MVNHNLKKMLKTLDESLKFDYNTADITLEDIHYVCIVCKRRSRKVSWFDLKLYLYVAV